jgi:hypothetical protein
MLCLFPTKKFAAEIARNERLTAAINDRVRVHHWLVAIDHLTWVREPRIRAITSWLDQKIASLPKPGRAADERLRQTGTSVSPNADGKYDHRGRAVRDLCQRP